MRFRVVAACVAAACVAACGSSSKSSSTSATTAKPGAGGPAPPGLVGVYTTNLTKKDLASNHARELQVPPG